MQRVAIPNYRLYREKSDESADFWLHSETIPVRSRLHNWEIATHRHEALFQLFWVNAGDGELVDARGAARAFTAPCAIFVPPGAAHGFRFATGTDGLVMTVLADRLALPGAADRRIARYLAQTRITSFAGDEQRQSERRLLDGLLSRIHAEIGAAGLGRDVLLEAMVTEAMVRLARAGVAAEARPAGAPTRDEVRLQELETLIAAHFREQRPVRFYAGRIGVSPAHLNRLTRRGAGMSTARLVTQRVLEAARRDLIFTPTPVQAIAYSLGFQDPAYFNRFFRRHTGMTPGAYRAAERRKMAG